MSIDYDALMAAIAEKLGEVSDGRVVTRSYRDFAHRLDSDLQAGIYTVLPGGVREYPHERSDHEEASGQTAMPVFAFRIIGQGVLEEAAEGDAIDAAEFAMVAELEAFADAVISDDTQDQYEELCRIRLLGWDQSSQLEAPYYWVAARFELGNML